MKRSYLPMLAVLFTGFAVISAAFAGDAGSLPATSNDYKILAPITHGDLTIFPVVSAKSHDTSDFITLDEGIRSGDVVVTEVGNLHSTMRRRPPYQTRPYQGAEVNRLVLVNNSKHPLILLAGEVVTGGKQDRVVSKDRIVPAESDPVDLAVFCVEHGRWIESSTKFDTHASVMLQPSVRIKAMADQDQQKVWDEVANSRKNMSGAMLHAPSAGLSTAEVTSAQAQIDNTSSYAKARENGVVQKQIESIVAPMQKSYESVIKQLRNQNAVGVVVAVKGHIVWADMFASSALLAKYWPKLLDSYATEALTMPGARGEISIKEAENFLQNWQARHEVVDSEPGLYRQRELIGDKFKAFQLTSLLTKDAFDLHLSKMAD
ncbi:MAG: ARPP-1 family domain-containing protein [Candidatus Angelobacter sp.]